jgi:hypothetical protein
MGMHVSIGSLYYSIAAASKTDTLTPCMAGGRKVTAIAYDTNGKPDTLGCSFRILCVLYHILLVLQRRCAPYIIGEAAAVKNDLVSRRNQCGPCYATLVRNQLCKGPWEPVYLTSILPLLAVLLRCQLSHSSGPLHPGIDRATSKRVGQITTHFPKHPVSQLHPY